VQGTVLLRDTTPCPACCCACGGTAMYLLLACPCAFPPLLPAGVPLLPADAAAHQGLFRSWSSYGLPRDLPRLSAEKSLRSVHWREDRTATGARHRVNLGPLALFTPLFHFLC